MNNVGLAYALFLAFVLPGGISCLAQDPSTAANAKAMVGKVPPGEGNRFALNLYAKLHRAKGNIFISPISLASALEMTRPGARGETSRQIAYVLQVSAEQDPQRPFFTATVRSISDDAKQRREEFVVADAFWGQRGFGFLEPYRELLAKSYGAMLGAVDFISDAAGASRVINAWVEKSTPVPDPRQEHGGLELFMGRLLNPLG